MSIYPEEIESVLAGFDGVSRLLQIVAERAGKRDRLVVRTEWPALGEARRISKPPVAEALARRLEAALLERNAELEEALREGWLAELRVEVLPPGGIPGIRRTGKIRKGVDARVE